MAITDRTIDHYLLEVASLAASGDRSGAVGAINDMGDTLVALVGAQYPAGAEVNGKKVGGQFMPTDGDGSGVKDDYLASVTGAFTALYQKSKDSIDSLFNSGQEFLDDIDSFLDGLPKIQIPDISENLPEVFQQSTKNVVDFVNKGLDSLDYSDLAVFLIGMACIAGPELIIGSMLGSASIGGVLASVVNAQALAIATDMGLDAAHVENGWVRFAISMALGIGLGKLALWKFSPVKAGDIAKQVKALEAKGKGIVTNGFAFPSAQDFEKAFMRPLTIDEGSSKFYVAKIGGTNYFLKAKSVFSGDAIGRSAAFTDIAKALDFEDAIIPFKKVVIKGEEYGASPFMPIESLSSLAEDSGFVGERGMKKIMEKILKPLIKKDPERIKKLSLLEFIGANYDNHSGNIVIDSGGKLRLIDFDATFTMGEYISKALDAYAYIPLNFHGHSPVLIQAKNLEYTRGELQFVLDREKQIRKAIQNNLKLEERTLAYKLVRAQLKKIQSLVDDFDDKKPPKIADLQLGLTAITDGEAAQKALEIAKEKGMTFLKRLGNAAIVLQDDMNLQN